MTLKLIEMSDLLAKRVNLETGGSRSSTRQILFTDSVSLKAKFAKICPYSVLYMNSHVELCDMDEAQNFLDLVTESSVWYIHGAVKCHVSDDQTTLSAVSSCGIQKSDSFKLNIINRSLNGSLVEILIVLDLEKSFIRQELIENVRKLIASFNSNTRTMFEISFESILQQYFDKKMSEKNQLLAKNRMQVSAQFLRSTITLSTPVSADSGIIFSPRTKQFASNIFSKLRHALWHRNQQEPNSMVCYLKLDLASLPYTIVTPEYKKSKLEEHLQGYDTLDSSSTPTIATKPNYKKNTAKRTFKSGSSLSLAVQKKRLSSSLDKLNQSNSNKDQDDLINSEAEEIATSDYESLCSSNVISVDDLRKRENETTINRESKDELIRIHPSLVTHKLNNRWSNNWLLDSNDRISSRLVARDEFNTLEQATKLNTFLNSLDRVKSESTLSCGSSNSSCSKKKARSRFQKNTTGRQSAASSSSLKAKSKSRVVSPPPPIFISQNGLIPPPPPSTITKTRFNELRSLFEAEKKHQNTYNNTKSLLNLTNNTSGHYNHLHQVRLRPQ